jgi:hypothetical protein
MTGPAKMNEEFPIRIMQNSRNYPWRFLFITILCGGLIGFFSGIFLKSSFEAQAKLTANVDIKENRPIVTELMIDNQIMHIGELLFHPEIIQPLLESETSLGNPLTLEGLYDISTIERQGMNTIIKVRSQDPNLAARIANSWGGLAFDRLEEAKTHAIKASEARQRIAMLNYCFPTKAIDSTLDSPSPNAIRFCQDLTFDQADNYLKESNQIILNEDPNSLGLSEALNLSAFTPSPIPTKPIQNSRGTLAFSGALIGLVLGIIGINLLDKKQLA